MSDENINNFTLERADTALLSRDFALAARLYKSVLKDNENNKDVLLKLGTCYVRANQDEKALEPYLRVLSLDKNNFDALNNLGGIYRRLGKYEESVKVLEAALKLGINTGEVNYNLGHTYKQMGHYDAAAESFYAVIDENPNDVLAYNHLGSIQAARGEYRKALQTYWRALQIDPNHPVLHYNSALSFVALGKNEDAINSYESALRTKPGWTEALEGYSALLLKENKHKKAEEVLTSAIQVTPNNVNLRNLMASLYLKKGSLEQAEAEYKKSLEYDRQNFDSLNGLSKIYEKLGRYSEAANLLKELEVVSQNKEEITQRQIALLIYQNKLKEAANLLKEARTKEPENVHILNLLAQFFIRSNEKNKELGCYRLIRNLDPNYITYLRDCGEQHNVVGNYEEAEVLLNKYLELNPNDTKALTSFAYTAEQKKEPSKALKTYQAVLEIEPENSIALGAISKIGMDTGPNSKAMEIITEILNKTTEESSSTLLNNSIKTYEETVKKLDGKPVKLSADDELLVSEMSKDIEEVFDVSLDELFTYDMNENIDFSEFEDNVIVLEEIDEETPQKRELDNLVAEDLPIDYIPTQKETEYYDPFEGTLQGKYSIEESKETLDVEGSPYFEEELDLTPEDQIFEEKTEIPLNPEGRKIETPQTNSPSMGYSQIPSGFVPVVPVSPQVEEGSSDLTFDVEPEEDSPYEEEIAYNDLLDDSELQEESIEENQELEVEPETEETQNLDEEETFEETEFSEETEPAPEPELEPELEYFSDSELSEDLEDPIADFENESLEETNAALEDMKNNELEETLQKDQKEILFPKELSLLKDLRDLCNWLPEEMQKDFSSSINKLRLDYLIEKLSGNLGLLGAAAAIRRSEGVPEESPSAPAVAEPIQRESLYKTMEYLHYLAAFLPNQQQAAALERESARVLERL